MPATTRRVARANAHELHRAAVASGANGAPFQANPAPIAVRAVEQVELVLHARPPLARV